MEAELVQVISAMADEYDYSRHERAADCTLAGILCFEVRVKRVHVDPRILMPDNQDRINPDTWRPLIMSFCRYYGLGPELVESELARIPELQYRSPDIDRAKQELQVPGRSEVPGEIRVPVEPFAGDELLDTIAP